MMIEASQIFIKVLTTRDRFTTNELCIPWDDKPRKYEVYD